MRSWTALLVVAMLASGPLAAARSDAPLQAALSPVQTAVDAAARLVGLALEESRRDGTPDAAMALRDQLDAYAARLALDWSLPDRATYRDEILAALPLVQEVRGRVAHVPEDAARAAVLYDHCARRELSPEETRQAAESAAALRATAGLLDETAARAPPGVDGAPISAAARGIVAWLDGYAASACAVAEAPFLALRVSPERTWPTGQIAVVAVTNLQGPVRLRAPALALEAEAPVRDGRATWAVTIPESAPRGVALLAATAGDLAAWANVTVDHAPTQLRFEGPREAQTGARVTLRLVLASPVPERTGNATILLENASLPRLDLRAGEARLALPAFDAPATLVLRAHYPGDAVAAPAWATHVLVVTAPAPETDAVALSGSAPALPATAELLRLLALILEHEWLALLALVLLLLLLALLVALLRRRRGAPAPRAPTPASAAPDGARAPVGLVWSGGLVGLVGSFVNLLRETGRASPALTFREIAHRLEPHGLDARPLVPPFEQARYDPRPTRDPPTDPAWFARAWHKLRGGGRP